MFREARKRPQVWNITLPDDDPRLVKVLELLRAAGLTPTDSFGKPGHFHMRIDRKYTKQELDAAEYLCVVPLPVLYVDGWILDRPLETTQSSLKGKDLLRLNPTLVLISAKIRAQAKECGLKRALYLPVRLRTRGNTIDTDDYCELSSDLVLPKVSDRHYLQDPETNEPFGGDYSRPVIVREGEFEPDRFYSNPEFHYNRCDIAALGEFDIALMCERRFTRGTVDFRSLIVSQKFRQFYLRNKLRGNWIPSRIDD